MHFLTRTTAEAKAYYKDQVLNAKAHATGVAFLEKGNYTKYGTIHTKRGLVCKAWHNKLHIEIMAAIVNGNAQGLNKRGPGYRDLIALARKYRIEETGGN